MDRMIGRFAVFCDLESGDFFHVRKIITTWHYLFIPPNICNLQQQMCGNVPNDLTPWGEMFTQQTMYEIVGMTESCSIRLE